MTMSYRAKRSVLNLKENHPQSPPTQLIEMFTNNIITSTVLQLYSYSITWLSGTLQRIMRSNVFFSIIKTL